MSRPERAAAASIAPRSGPSPAITSGQSRPARSTTSTRCECPCSAPACRGRARTARRGAARSPRRVRAGRDVHGIGNDLEPRARRSPARARAGRRAIVVLTATIASAAARPERLRARFARMYGIIGSASGHDRAGARPDAPRHHAGRAVRDRATCPRACGSGRTSSTPASSRERCRRPGGRAGARPSIDGRHVSTCWPCTRSMRSRCDDVGENVGERRVEPLVLEVVPDVRQRRRGRAELEDAKAVVVALAAPGRRARPRLHDDHVMSAARAGRAPARTCSTRCRRTRAGTSRWRGGRAFDAESRVMTVEV